MAGKEITLKLFNSNFVLYGQLTGGRYIQGTKTLTETEEEMVNAFIRIPANTVCDNLKVYPQIELGSGTSYKEYKEEICLLNTQREMLEEDYIDLNSNMEVHNWKALELTGEEDWRYEAHIEGKKTIVMKMTIEPALDISSGVCTHFNYIGDYNLDKEHCYVGTSGVLFIFVNYSIISTVEEFKAFLKSCSFSYFLAASR